MAGLGLQGSKITKTNPKYYLPIRLLSLTVLCNWQQVMGLPAISGHPYFSRPGAHMKKRSLWMRAAGLFVAILLSLPLHEPAQQEGDNGGKKLSKEELAQLLAPIALYPDELVSQILMASTYPLEIVQADRWVKSHKQSAGDVLAKQLEKENWDPSVKSLVNFPEVLAKMSEKLDLTTKIGDAFLAQQKDVMETIQESAEEGA